MFLGLNLKFKWNHDVRTTIYPRVCQGWICLFPSFFFFFFKPFSFFFHQTNIVKSNYFCCWRERKLLAIWWNENMDIYMYISCLNSRRHSTLTYKWSSGVLFPFVSSRLISTKKNKNTFYNNERSPKLLSDILQRQHPCSLWGAFLCFSPVALQSLCCWWLSVFSCF